MSDTPRTDACIKRNSSRSSLVQFTELAETAYALERELVEANRSLAFHKKRTALLEKVQVTMRDPERKMVCDILANGNLSQDGYHLKGKP